MRNLKDKSNGEIVKDILEKNLLRLHMGLLRDIAKELGSSVNNRDTKKKLVSKIVDELIHDKNNITSNQDSEKENL